MSGDCVKQIDVFIVDLSQDVPYLGELREGETVNESGYFVRKGNRTVYPRKNRSLVVRIESESGAVGWGETYGLVAPKATAEIINDLLTGFVLQRDPEEVEAIHDELYDLMRVRGYTGGFYLDALAAIDIAMWDLRGRQAGKSIAELLGGRKRQTIPAYVSGLPKPTLSERCEFAAEWKESGFDHFKFALPVADDGALAEIRALRKTLGSEAGIGIDLHWSLDAESAIQLAKELAPFDPWFLEAPVPTEEIDQLAQVAREANQTIAVGEEWRTLFDAKLRIDRQACHLVQPEMGHTGITEFVRICEYAARHDIPVNPHATIGSGIFLAASLQTSAAMSNVVGHEFQHSIFEPFRHFTGGAICCEEGQYQLPDGTGLGVEPTKEMLAAMTPVS